MIFGQMPREELFFTYFEEAARNVTECALLLQEIVDDFSDVEAKADRMRALEARGDEITVRIITRLGKSFITPIEREDILAIARGLDDIVDLIDATAARLAAYAIDKPTDEARAFVRLIVQSARDLEQMLSLLYLRDIDRIRLPKMAVNRAESEGDVLLRRVVAALFASGADALTVMKWKEIYEILEEVTDRQETLANLIEGVIVKNS